MTKKILPMLICFLFIPLVAKADLGPKPSMYFNFIFETTNQVSVINGEQFICQDKQCFNSKILQDNGPQGFWCKGNYCQSLAYGYDSKYHKIKIQFSDKTRESNVFKYESFDSNYDVIVDNEKLTIVDKTPFLHKYNIVRFLIASLITIIIELIVGLYFVLKNKFSKKVLILILFVNFVTLPLIWFLMPRILNLPFYLIGVLIKETIVIIIEAFFIFYFFKQYFNWKSALNFSIAINLASWLIGGFIENIMLNNMMIFDFYGAIEAKFGIGIRSISNIDLIWLDCLFYPILTFGLTFALSWAGWIIFKKGKKYSLFVGFIIAIVLAVISSYMVITIGEKECEQKRSRKTGYIEVGKDNLERRVCELKK